MPFVEIALDATGIKQEQLDRLSGDPFILYWDLFAQMLRAYGSYLLSGLLVFLGVPMKGSLCINGNVLGLKPLAWFQVIFARQVEWKTKLCLQRSRDESR